MHKYIHLNTFLVRGILSGIRKQIMLPYAQQKNKIDKYTYSIGDMVLVKEGWKVIYIPGRLSLPDKEGIVFQADNYFMSCSVKKYWENNETWRNPMRLPTAFIRMYLKITAVENLYLKDITKQHLEVQGFTGTTAVTRFIEYWNRSHPRKLHWKHDPRVLVHTFEINKV